MEVQPIPKPGKRPAKSKREPNPQKNSRIIDPEAIKQARRPYCQMCGLSKSSEPYAVHHIVYRSGGGSDIPENLINLCVKCHEEAHKGIIKKDTLRDMAAMDREG
jgi:5-methylcytosine-specific restriction endonuclease McrA